jgi:hypothetical protein
MRKTIVSIALGAVLNLAPVVSVGQTGYGVKPGAPSASTFHRRWNRANESKDRARAGAEYMRERRTGAAHHYHRVPRHPEQ